MKRGDTVRVNGSKDAHILRDFRSTFCGFDNGSLHMEPYVHEVKSTAAAGPPPYCTQCMASASKEQVDVMLAISVPVLELSLTIQPKT